MTQYFSDRELGELPRASSELSATAWQGIAWLIQDRINNGSFRRNAHEKQWESEKRFDAMIKAEIPDLPGRMDNISRIQQPTLVDAMDVIEFCWREVGRYELVNHYGHVGQGIETLDKQAGQEEFKEHVNHMFRRNGVTFDLTDQGKIERLIPGPVGSALRSVVFQTRDPELDQLLETARRKILVPDENEHGDALEKLWDAWERLKTVEYTDKAKGTAIMLDKAAGASQPNLRDLLEAEAKALTDAGNKLRIRHWETNQERLETSQQVDYLFQRMFSLIQLILRSAGRVG